MIVNFVFNSSKYVMVQLSLKTQIESRLIAPVSVLNVCYREYILIRRSIIFCSPSNHITGMMMIDGSIKTMMILIAQFNVTHPAGL